SVDPENDTPEKLRDYAKRFNAGERWHLLTGSKEQVSAALAKLGMAVDDRDAHVNILIVGNLRTGLWKKVLGIASPDKVLEAVKGVVDDRGE
ncbi:MAG TPA: SCO family protein, partial [Thermoanaerobaculia bacterium]|nr:SCO family protein [Thermoanaerobaculia bacterium]